MATVTERIDLVFHRNVAHEPFEGIDFGPLLDDLTTTPEVFAKVIDPTAKVTIELRRTHEWELLVGIGIKAGSAFATAFAVRLAAHLGTWAADKVAKRFPGTKPKVEVGGKTVRIDPANLTRAAKIIETALKAGMQVKKAITFVLDSR